MTITHNQSAKTDFVHFANVTCNCSLNDFEKFTPKWQAIRKKLLGISMSASMAAKLEGPITIVFCLTQITVKSKMPGLTAHGFAISKPLVGTERMASLIESLKKKYGNIMDLYTTEINKESAKQVSDTAVNTCLNQKIHE